MKFFSRRQPLDDFLEALKPELLALQTPAPTQALRDRIIVTRLAGGRTLLPNVTEPRRPAVRSVLSIAIVAVLMLLLVPVGLQRASFHVPGADEATDGFFGAIAYAQPVRAISNPALAPIRLLASRLRPMSLEFARRVHDDKGQVLSNSPITLDVAADSISTVAAWRMTSLDNDTRTTRRWLSSETTYVARSDLRLLRRMIHVAPFSRFQRINLLQRFAGDSITGRMNTDGPTMGAGRTFARRLPSTFAPYLTDRIAPVFLMSVRLAPDWRGSASVLGWAVRDNDVSAPIELRVEGSETITVPAGRFDCWRLSIRFGAKHIDYWARKSDGLGIRVLDPNDSPNRTREVVLVRER